ncbi:LysR family transcriptional regulator [Curvivirga sp.]|uniref:LysR family transcriptional regulator n=1 Tax=Curvivirga sp. TaxID=2856848 RepID=UPI003B5B48E0
MLRQIELLSFYDIFIEFLASIEFSPVTQSKLPPLNALKSFEVYGRHLNLKDAAEELSVTESAVSRQLKQMEEYLGAKLFEKVGRNNQLTEKGEEYLNVVSQHLKEIADNTALMFPKELPASQNKKVILGVYPAFAEYWLLPRMEKIQHDLPEMELEIRFNSITELYAPLPHVDLEIFLGDVQPSTAHSIKLHRMHDFPVCTQSLLNDFNNDGYRLLQEAVKLHEGSLHWWPRWLKKMGIEERNYNNKGPLLIDEAFPIKMALQKSGIALGDHISCHDLLNKRFLCRPVSEIEITDYWINLLTPISKTKQPQADQFKEWIIGEMKIFNSNLDDYTD